MITFYLLMLTIVALVIYAGYDATMRLIQYLDMQVQYAGITLRMKWFAWKLRRRLSQDIAEYEKLKKETNKDVE